MQSLCIKYVSNPAVVVINESVFISASFTASPLLLLHILLLFPARAHAINLPTCIHQGSAQEVNLTRKQHNENAQSCIIIHIESQCTSPLDDDRFCDNHQVRQSSDGPLLGLWWSEAGLVAWRPRWCVALSLAISQLALTVPSVAPDGAHCSGEAAATSTPPPWSNKWN